MWLAIGLGCLWLGLQIVWVAPTPRPFKTYVVTEAGRFQRFWLDQYAWIGIGLLICGLGFVGTATIA